MLISHRFQFIYTKTMKTAGTSVESFFEPYCMPEGEWSFSHAREERSDEAGIIGFRGKDPHANVTWRSHAPAEDIKAKLGDQIWNEYFKFCVIRDPFDKLVSAFHFHKFRERKNTTSLPPKESISAEQVIHEFREWLKNGGNVADRNRYTIDGMICVDHVIRFEELSSGIEEVCQRLGLPFDPKRIPKLKSGIRPEGIELCDYYDPEAIGLVARRFAFELETFGYEAPRKPVCS